MVHGIAKGSSNSDNLNIVNNSFTGYTFQVGFTRFPTTTLAIRLVFLTIHYQMFDIQHSLFKYGDPCIISLNFYSRLPLFKTKRETKSYMLQYKVKVNKEM